MNAGDQVVVVSGPFEGYEGGIIMRHPAYVSVYINGIHALPFTTAQLRLRDQSHTTPVDHVSCCDHTDEGSI